MVGKYHGTLDLHASREMCSLTGLLRRHSKKKTDIPLYCVGGGDDDGGNLVVIDRHGTTMARKTRGERRMILKIDQLNASDDIQH